MFWMPKGLPNCDGFILSLAHMYLKAQYMFRARFIVNDSGSKSIFQIVVLTILNFFGQLLVRSD